MNWDVKFTKIEKTSIQFSDSHLPIAFIKSSKFSLLTSLNFPHNSAISILGARKALLTQCWSQDATVNSEESSCYRIRSRSCLLDSQSSAPAKKTLGWIPGGWADLRHRLDYSLATRKLGSPKTNQCLLSEKLRQNDASIEYIGKNLFSSIEWQTENRNRSFSYR